MIGKTNAQIILYGGTLTVSAPENAVVTLSCDTQTKQATADASGKAVFRGVSEGMWTISITNPDGVTNTRNVVVTTGYAISMSFFNASIEVTYPAGSVCTCSGGGATQTAPDQTGRCTFDVISAGSYTVTATHGENSDTKVVSITANGQHKTVVLIYNRIPKFTYTGNYEIVNDANEPITASKDNWKVRFITSGTLTMLEDCLVDVFCVGGGGGGGYDQGGGGGGGYTLTERSMRLLNGESYTISIGAGGARTTSGTVVGSDGGKTIFNTGIANGGQGGGCYSSVRKRLGGNGGSGGGGGGETNLTAGNGGSDGSNGFVGTSNYGAGAGQGTTTREFGEASGALYAGGGAGGTTQTNTTAIGGAGGGGNESVNGTANTGGGGGGGGWNTPSVEASYPGNGGSGIVVIRNARG